MALEVIFRNLKLTEDEREQIEERAQRKLAKVARFLNGSTTETLILRQERHRHRGELTVTGAGEQLFRVEVDASDWVAVVDTAMNKLARALRRHKDRLSGRHRTLPAAMASEDGFGKVSVEQLVAELEEEFDLWTEEVLKATG